MFQDKNNNYWFGSDGQGVCRYDGKTITRFTTKDGLSHDQVRGIQQHASTGHILITTNAGVSKFDGQGFVTLPMREMKSPNDGWVLNANDVWMTGAGGPPLAIDKYDVSRQLGAALATIGIHHAKLRKRAIAIGEKWESIATIRARRAAHRRSRRSGSTRW